jgi:hypothetical protein
MKTSDIKKLIISSLDSGNDAGEYAGKLEKEGVTFSFSNEFRDQVIEKIFSARIILKHETEYLKNLNFVFRRIAISGVAAIIVLLISIFIMEGKISVNSFLGLKDSFDESIVCLLTGN